ncbi:hypothetical protein QQ045_004803 [Rhodiola kirilowii]
MKMTFTLRAVKVPLNSASLEEARVRTFDFFRTARRSMSRIMDICNLHDVATISHLRSTVASQIRKNAIVTNPKFRLHYYKVRRDYYIVRQYYFIVRHDFFIVRRDIN